MAPANCRMDDPIIWGTLPLRDSKILAPFNRRWAFGSHDICFSNRYAVPAAIRMMSC